MSCLSFDDGGYNAPNKLQFNSKITFGINQFYQNAITDKECFANTHYCLSQGGQTQPFSNFYMVRKLWGSWARLKQLMRNNHPDLWAQMESGAGLVTEPVAEKKVTKPAKKKAVKKEEK